MKKFIYLFAALATMCLTACSNNDEPTPNPSDPQGVASGLYVVCEGMYSSPSASLSFFDTETGTATNNIFRDANGYPLGSVAQSMTIIDNTGWIVVNNSGIIYAIDLKTNKEVGRVTGLVSPRYVCKVSDDKVYVSQMYSNEIAIVNPKTYKVTGHIIVPDMNLSDFTYGGSTEEMILIGDYVYCNCWSYQNDIIKIDTKSDKVVNSLNVGIQPKSIAYSSDAKDCLWVLVDGGGWEQNPAGFEAPSIVIIDLKYFTFTAKVELPLYQQVSHLTANGSYLYWLVNGTGVMRASISDTNMSISDKPYIAIDSWSLYSLTVSPEGEVYVGNALDYQQNGTVTRYDANGAEVKTMEVGICPSNFCWK